MNARLRSVVFSGLLTIGAFSAITWSSCTEDKCKAIACANTGVCNNGSCLCPSGYEGPQCETVNRDRYKGVWQVTEDGTLSSAAQYPISIENGENVTRIKIKNLRNFFSDEFFATVKGDTMVLDQKTTTNGYTINGNGYIADDIYYGNHGKMIVSYSVTAPNGDVDYYGLGQGNASLWNK